MAWVGQKLKNAPPSSPYYWLFWGFICHFTYDVGFSLLRLLLDTVSPLVPSSTKSLPLPLDSKCLSSLQPVIAAFPATTAAPVFLNLPCLLSSHQLRPPIWLKVWVNVPPSSLCSLALSMLSLSLPCLFFYCAVPLWLSLFLCFFNFFHVLHGSSSLLLCCPLSSGLPCLINFKFQFFYFNFNLTFSYGNIIISIFRSLMMNVLIVGDV